MNVPKLKPSRRRRFQQHFQLTIYRLSKLKKLKYKIFSLGIIKTSQLTFFLVTDLLKKSKRRKFRKFSEKLISNNKINAILPIIYGFLFCLIILNVIETIRVKNNNFN